MNKIYGGNLISIEHVLQWKAFNLFLDNIGTQLVTESLKYMILIKRASLVMPIWQFEFVLSLVGNVKESLCTLFIAYGDILEDKSICVLIVLLQALKKKLHGLDEDACPSLMVNDKIMNWIAL